MIPDTVDRDEPILESSLKSGDSRGVLKSPGSIQHMRFYASCYDEKTSDRILEATRTLELELPELTSKQVYSWDQNKIVTRYTIKCWIPLTLDYQEIHSAIRVIVHGQAGYDVPNELLFGSGL